MGYSFEQYEPQPDEDLICSICHDVFEDPVGTECGHSFCRACITDWLEGHANCPVDRIEFGDNAKLTPAITVRSIVSKLNVKCTFHGYGCLQLLKIAEIPAHEPNCNFDPQPIPCPKDCGAILRKLELDGHDCKVWMKAKIDEQAKEIVNINQRVMDSNQEINELKVTDKSQKETVMALKQENEVLKASIKKLKISKNRNTKLKRADEMEEFIIDT